MAYTPHTWIPRLGSGLNKYKDQNNITYTLTPTPDAVTQEGTPFSAAWMNELETGVTDAHVGRRVFFATCGTAAATKAKVVTITDFTADHLVAGTIVTVKFSSGNSNSAPTLNINSTGAANITCGAYGNDITNLIGSDQPFMLQYNGASWDLLNPLRVLVELKRYTSSGTFDPASYPSIGNKYVVMLLGAGGASFLNNGTYYHSGGAGAMQFVEIIYSPAMKKSSFAVVIGAVASNSDGGATSFDFFTSPGGKKPASVSDYGLGGSTGAFAGEIGQFTRGGDSLYGTGATSTAAATGYGAGGFENQLGTGGLVIIYGYKV